MKIFLIIILSIGILLQFYFGDKAITKWSTLARENHTELSDCIRKNGNLSEACDGLLKELEKLKDTVFVSLVEPPSKLDKPVFDIVAHRKVTVEQGWENDKCFNLRQLSTVGWYKGCIVYNKKVNEPLDPSKEYSEYFGTVKKITPVMVYAEREKAANFMIAYVRKMKGKECNE